MADPLRAWFEAQLQERPDGFLVRPLGCFGGVFVLPDAATKDWYVARRAAIARMDAVGRGLSILPMMLFLGLAFEWIWPVDLLPSAALMALLFGSPMIAHLGISAFRRWCVFRQVRRSARRVPRERWFGPPPSEEVPFHVLPAWTVLFLVMVVLAMSI